MTHPWQTCKSANLRRNRSSLRLTVYLSKEEAVIRNSSEWIEMTVTVKPSGVRLRALPPAR